MGWQAFRAQLVNAHVEKPQEIAQVDHALGLVEEGLRLLAARGHLLHLREGPAPPAGWPRLYYHLTAAPRGHEVYCEQDVALLGEGWFPTLDEAKHADGLGMQFRRGGIIPKRGLPVVAHPEELSDLDKERRNGLE